MDFNPMQLFQLIRNGGNPQQFLMNMLKQQSNSNPMMGSLLNLAQNNDTKGIEQIARNVLKEQGKDFDKEFSKFKQTLGL